MVRSRHCPPLGSLAQLVEQLTFNQLVAGSNPARLHHSQHLTQMLNVMITRCVSNGAPGRGEAESSCVPTHQF